jgi:hypothetical protein
MMRQMCVIKRRLESFETQPPSAAYQLSYQINPVETFGQLVKMVTCRNEIPLVTPFGEQSRYVDGMAHCS